MGQGLPGAGGSPPSASPTRPRAVGSTPQLTSARGHAVGDHGRAGHGVEAVLSFVGTHVALQSLGWGPGEGGGGHRAGGGPSPAHHLPQGRRAGRRGGRWGFWPRCPPPPPLAACLPPKVRLSIPLTHRQAHQGHQQQGEQGRHGWRREGRGGVETQRAGRPRFSTGRGWSRAQSGWDRPLPSQSASSTGGAGALRRGDEDG